MENMDREKFIKGLQNYNKPEVNALDNLNDFQRRDELENKEFKRKQEMRARRREDKAQREKRRKIMGVAAIGATAFLSVAGWKAFANSRSQEPVEHREPTIEQTYNTKPKEEPKAYENIYGESSALKYMKNIYIEKYEQMTGDTELTTEDITMHCAASQDRVYVDNETGQMITHGKKPEETEMKLLGAGVSWHTVDDVDVYRVKKKEGGIIDSIAVKGGNVYSVIEGSQYGEERISVLDEMGDVIPKGLDYIDAIGTVDEELTREEFVEAAKEYEEKEEQNQNLTAKTEKEDEEMER